MTGSAERHGGVPVDHSRQVPRLARIEGQVRGLARMIEEGRDCVDVAHQVNAVVAALRRVQADMLRDHLTAIAAASTQGTLPEAERQRLADEVARLLARTV